MNQPTTPTAERSYDLAVLVGPRRLALVRCNGIGVAPQFTIPLGGRTEAGVLREVLAGALRSYRPRRLLVSVEAGVSHERILDPVTDTACAFVASCGAGLVWLPDVSALAAALEGTLPQAGSDLVDRLRTLAARARPEEPTRRV